MSVFGDFNSVEGLRIGIRILGAFVAGCFLMLMGGLIEKRTRLPLLAQWLGIASLAAVIIFVIFAALLLI
jgi:hypothetical protein